MPCSLDGNDEVLEERIDPLAFDYETLDDECRSMSYGAAYVHALEAKRAEYGDVGADALAAPTSRWLSDHGERARRRGGMDTLTGAEWHQILLIFDYSCAYCGNRDGLQMDHVEAIARGGDHSAWNVVPACKRCNLSKGARDVESWCGHRGLNYKAVALRLERARNTLRANPEGLSMSERD